MTITAYYPILYRNDLDAAYKQYTEELGFKVCHKLKDDEMRGYVLEINGYRMEIIHLELPQFKDRPDGYLAMRVNVREMDEALDYYQSHGYDFMEGIFRDESHSFAPLINKNGDIVFLSHHFRDDECHYDFR